MSEVKFTPGEWDICHTDSDSLWVCGGENKDFVVAFVQGKLNNIGGSNAHLIAAAPEMYKALQELIDIDYLYDTSTFADELQPLILKVINILKEARGEE